MKSHALRRTVLAMLVLVFPAHAAAQSPAPHTARDRIGVYDSRAIAIAFAGSPAQRKLLEPLRAAQQRAKQAGDQAEVARIDAQGRALQEQAHRQAFSTAPVDDLFEFIADALPEIRRAAGVATLISMWNETELARHPDAERVDVTSALVDAFHPLDRQRKVIEEIRKKKPLPLEKVTGKRD